MRRRPRLSGSLAARRPPCGSSSSKVTPTLKEAVGSPYRGVLTGLNEAFIVDRATRDRLVYADIASKALFKPYLEGKDIKRWQVESEDRWLILLPKGWAPQRNAPSRLG